jgi:hypothetical protein
MLYAYTKEENKETHLQRKKELGDKWSRDSSSG